MAKTSGYKGEFKEGPAAESIISLSRALSLIPISPLSIDEADFQIEFRVSHIFHKVRIQESEHDKIKEKEKDSKYDSERRLTK
jgi:hypothetical protein